jgi:Flp pilus assembly protein TadD
MNSIDVAGSVAAANVSTFDEAVCLMTQRQAKVVQAETLLRRVLEVTPDDVPAWHLLQRCLKLQWRFTEALAAVDHGLELAQALSPERTDYVAAMHTARSLLLHDLGQPAAALVAAHEALKLDPSNDDFQFNLAQARLMGGDWTGGFHLYQSRWAARLMMAQGEGGPLPWPMWCGETPKAGDSLLVFGEGDSSDILQFARELLALRACFSQVTLLCQPATQRLLQQSLGPNIVCTVEPPTLAHERRSPSWDWHLPLMSLPAIMAHTPQTLPQCVPYLFADSDRVHAWGERLAQHETAQGGRRLRVGLVWGDQMLQSQPDEMERRRTVPLRLFESMLARSDVLWVSLQQGAARMAELDHMDAALHPLPWVAECGDFAEIAALAANLDLVISADTSMAHLAGGLGRPVWLLNRFESEWRWLWRREDTPWYPTMRIFNQTRFGDWAEVLNRVDMALDPLVRRHPDHDVAVAKRALHAGTVQRAAGRIDQAETAYRVALTLAPDWAPVHCELGDLLRAQGNCTEAETAYRQALCLQPDMSVAAASLAQLLIEQGRRQEAEVYARRG